MTGLVRKAALLSASGLLAASAAMAGVPEATTSSLTSVLGNVITIPVTMLQAAGEVPDPGNATEGLFTGPTARKVTVRDFSLNPISGCSVKITFADCCDIELCSVSGQAGVSNDNALHTVSGFTNAGGEFTFIVIGAGQNVEAGTVPIQDGCGINTSVKAVRVIANSGVGGDKELFKATGYVFNQDGGATTGSPLPTPNATGADVIRVAQDVATYQIEGVIRGRSDLNHDASLTGGGDVTRIANEVARLNLIQTGSACGSGTLGNRVATCP